MDSRTREKHLGKCRAGMHLLQGNLGHPSVKGRDVSEIVADMLAAVSALGIEAMRLDYINQGLQQGLAKGEADTKARIMEVPTPEMFDPFFDGRCAKEEGQRSPDTLTLTGCAPRTTKTEIQI